MANGNNTAKVVSLIALGGLTDMALQYLSSVYVKDSMQADKVTLYAADGIGAAVGVGSIAVGSAAKKPAATLFGAGALATAAGVLLGKTLLAYNPLNASARVASATYAGPVTPRASKFTVPVSPQSALMVGSSGGGKQVYKQPQGATTDANKTVMVMG